MDYELYCDARHVRCVVADFVERGYPFVVSYVNINTARITFDVPTWGQVDASVKTQEGGIMRKLEDEIKAIKAAAVQLHYDFVMPGVCVCIESAYAEDPTGGRASALMTECRKRMDRLYDLGLYAFAPVKNQKLAKIQKMTSVPVVGYRDTPRLSGRCYASERR